MARVIAICSGKGGVGKTTIAANLAMSLRMLGRSVCVVDCNLTTPHLGILFKAYSSPVTLNDFLRGNASVSEASYTHDSGLVFVPSSIKLFDMIGVDTKDLRWNLREAFGWYDFIILDSAPGLGREAMIPMKVADELLFVTDPSIYSVVDVKKAKFLAESVQGISGYRPHCLGVVINRSRRRPFEASPMEISDITGLSILGNVPEDDGVMECNNSNETFVSKQPTSPASREVRRIAQTLCGRADANHDAGLFHRFRALMGWTRKEPF
jgi:septum site-determining protein MinD